MSLSKKDISNLQDIFLTKSEFNTFKNDTTSFQYEMIEFRNEMAGFNNEMTGFKNDAMNNFDALFKKLSDIKTELISFGNHYKRQNKLLENHEVRIQGLEAAKA
ncbi:MAG: hypothetical protein KKB81_01870 [Candidatus Margulisbacteria bacterium]|nr:hypothetical protein [Candidatus Margulisiibacteriota bacterium]MBU1021664.1 hypothetical protein [Candidatus Margulisiibacteriota bacterium]MBU1728814.1 hypothetical protein [Candidatus Margulisiibacteriota bacterium]MBU1955780.1 hypothetical protein [Candidatus Margulisiibacteriota bacterium]